MQSSSAGEEIHQYRRKSFESYIVGLSFQRTGLCVRNCFAECLGCVIHEWVTCSTIHEECRYGYDGCPFGGY